MNKLKADYNSDLPQNSLVKLIAKNVVSFSSQYGRENSFTYTASNLVKPLSFYKYPLYGDFQECFLLVSKII